jgi:hypothetical protein
MAERLGPAKKKACKHDSKGEAWVCDILRHAITHVYAQLGTIPNERQYVLALYHELIGLGPEFAVALQHEAPVPVLFKTSAGQAHLLGTDRIDLLLTVLDDELEGGVRSTIIEVKKNSPTTPHLVAALHQAQRYATLLQMTEDTQDGVYTIAGIVFPKEGDAPRDPIYQVRLATE